MPIETVTSAITAMIQLANHRAVFGRLKESVLFILAFVKIKALYSIEKKIELLCCSILKCSVSILWTFINFAQYQILIKLLHLNAMDFPYFAEENMNKKIGNIQHHCHNFVKLKINKTLIKRSVIFKYRNPYNLSRALD